MRYALINTTTKLVDNIIELTDQDTLADIPTPAPQPPVPTPPPAEPRAPVLLAGGDTPAAQAMMAAFASRHTAWEQTCKDLVTAYNIALEAFTEMEYKWAVPDGFTIVKDSDSEIFIGVTTYEDGEFVTPEQE